MNKTMNQKHREHQEQEQQKFNNNDYYNVSPGARRAPLASAEDFARIRETYVDNIGPMTGAAAKMIEQALEAEISVEDVISAIELTGLAPRPSPWYLRAILEDWEYSGVHYSRARMSKDAGSWYKG